MNNKPHIFFDLDHTLWDFDKNSKETLFELFTEKQLEKEIGDFEVFYQRYVKINEECWSYYRMGNLKKEALRKKRFKDTFLDFDFINTKIIHFFTEEYVKRSPFKKNLIPGAIELLEYLKEKELPLHIITNGFKEIQNIKLNNSSLSIYFDVVLCSEDTGAKKPSKIVFETAMEKAQATPAKSFMIGDNWDADVKGSENAGMKPIWYHQGKMNSEGILQVKDLCEITKLI